MSSRATRNGFILTGINAGGESLLETSIPGVFAAGEVRWGALIPVSGLMSDGPGTAVPGPSARRLSLQVAIHVKESRMTEAGVPERERDDPDLGAPAVIAGAVDAHRPARRRDIAELVGEREQTKAKSDEHVMLIDASEPN
jgi:hypothetical protein